MGNVLEQVACAAWREVELSGLFREGVLLRCTPDGELHVLTPIGQGSQGELKLEHLQEGIEGPGSMDVWIERVALAEGLDAWVDDIGRIRNLPYNPIASAMCSLIRGRKVDLVGSVLFASGTHCGDSVVLDRMSVDLLREKWLELKRRIEPRIDS